jgi:hypothetical protein
VNVDEGNGQTLTSNLQATIEVNPELEYLRFELATAEGMLASAKRYKPEEDGNVKGADQLAEASKARTREVKECVEEVVNAQSALDNYNSYENASVHPTVVIGYMPARKLTEIRRKQMALISMDIDEEQMEKSSELDRLIVMWGVKGHREVRIRGEEVPFGAATVKYKGATYTLAGDVAIDAYERMDWLKPLAAAIGNFNNLTVEKKSRSGSTSGEETETSAATSA